MRSLWLTLACLGIAIPVRADEPNWIRADLVLESGPDTNECIDQPGLEQAIESRLGRPVFAPRAEADVTVHARLRRSDERWEAELVLHDRSGRELGTRELQTEAKHCSSLDDSLALALVLMLDVPRDELPPPPQPHPATPVRLPEDTPARRAPWGWQVGALGTVSLGTLPGLAPGLRLSGGVQPPRFWLIEIDSTLWPSREAEESGGGVRLGGWAVGTYLCPLGWASGPWSGSGCVGQQVGWYSAEGYGYDRVEGHSPLYYSVGLRSRAGLRLWGPLALRAGLGVEVPLVRDRFVYQRADGTPDGLFRAAPVAGVAELGLGLLP